LWVRLARFVSRDLRDMETFVLEELRYGGRAGGAGHALSMRRTGAGGLRSACRGLYIRRIHTESTDGVYVARVRGVAASGGFRPDRGAGTLGAHTSGP